MSVDTPKVDGLRILSLDAGDLNCISQLKILEEFMKRLEYDSLGGKSMRPCEYFHSITGVGGSGVIAILLGVLGLSVDDAIDAFLRLCEGISLGEEIDPLLRSEKLVSATKAFLQGISVPEESKLRGDLTRGAGCKVSIPYMAAADMTHCRMLRSYDSGHSSHNPTIIEAISIAWADPGLFSSVRIGPNLMQEELVSAVDGCSNPTLQAIEEAHKIFGKDQKVACLLSLGTGKSGVRSLTTNGARLAQMIARDTERTAEQSKKRYNGLQTYFRLSVDRNIDLGTSPQAIEQSAGRISSYTSSYLETHDASEILDGCLRSSYQASHITMENMYRTRPSGFRSSMGLPPLSAFFVAREKPMNDIVEALRIRMPGSPAIGLVLGLSGTGKTQISLKYAYDHDEEYVIITVHGQVLTRDRYDHIIFVDASSTESFEKGLITRIKLIDNQLDVTNAEGAVKLLVDPKGKLTRNWLIIMDNADNSNVKLQDYIPSCDHGCVLITSRNAALSDLNPDGHVEMGVMSREEAIEALLSAALGHETNPRSERREESRMGRLHSSPRTKRDEECAGRIVDELGRLPLAVIQAACYIKKQKCLHQYPKLLKTSRNKILRWPASIQRDTLKYAHSTYAAFDTTLSALSSRALKFLGIISFVNFSDFPKALIELAATLEFNYQPNDLLDRPPEYKLSVDLLREIFCPGGDWDPMELDGLLEELQSYSLVSLVAVSTIITLRFHPLLHGWANDRLSTSDRVMFQSAAVRLLVCGTNMDDDYLWPYLSSHIERFPLTTDELHVNDKAAFSAILRSNGQYSKASNIWEKIHASVEAVHGETHLRTTRATLRLAITYGDRGDVQKMESMERRVVEIRRQTLGDTHLETVHAMANLAVTCREHGKRYDEAARLGQQVLHVMKELHGPKHRKIVDAITSLADTYEEQKKYAEAQALLLEGLDMITSLVGRAHLVTIGVLEQLAHCYTLSGNDEEAIGLDQDVVELRRTILGDTHVETLTAIVELYYKQGQVDTAEKIWRDLIYESREAVGGHHEQILQSLSGLARSVFNQKRNAEAEVLWREIVAGRRKTLGAEHPDTLDAVDWVFRSLYEQERYAEAEALGREVVAGMRQTLGDKHADTLSAIYCQAECIHYQERYEEAEALWREVLTARRLTLGAEHADTLDTQDWVARSLSKQKRHTEAETIGREVVAGMRKILGDKHIDTLDALDTLAICIFDQERYEEADDLWKEVLATRRLTLGDEHADTLDTLDWMLRSLSNQERYAEAETIGRELVAGMRKTIGDKHAETLDAVDSLAICIFKQERYEEAAALWRKVLTERRLTLGDEHADTLDTLDWVLQSLYEQERYAEAEAIGRELVAGMRQTFGDKHDGTCDALDWLAHTIYFQDREAEAEELWRELVATRRDALGDTHEDTLDSLYWLSLTLYDQEKYAEAESLLLEVVTERRKTLGGQHDDTLDALESLGSVINDQDRFSEAETIRKEILTARRETAGDMHEDTLQALDSVAHSIYDQERYEEAETLWKEVVAGRREVLGDSDEDTLEAGYWLSLSIHDQLRYKEAENLLAAVLKKRRETLGDRDTDTMDTAYWLALSIYNQERYEEAETLWREVVVGSREELGENDEDTLDTLLWLALAVEGQKRHAEAEVLWRELLAGNRITFGDQHDNTLNTLYHLGDSVSSQARYAEAETLYKEALAGMRETLGDQHEDTLEVLHSLGGCLYNQERYAECEALWREQLPLSRSTLGDQHSDTLDAIHWLGRSVYAQQRYAEAEALWKEEVAARRDTLGLQNDGTVEAQTWLNKAQSATAVDLVPASPPRLEVESGDHQPEEISSERPATPEKVASPVVFREPDISTVTTKAGAKGSQRLQRFKASARRPLGKVIGMVSLFTK